MEKAEVVIAIPAGDAWIHARLVQSLIPQLVNNKLLIVAGVSPVAYARNQIVEQFLKTGADWLWQIDSDTLPDLNALEKLMSVDAPIVTGVTPILRQGSKTSNIYLGTGGAPMTMEEVAAKTEPFEVEGCGASCLLVKREVFEKVGVPYFFEAWEGGTGRHASEDIMFCNSAKDVGYKILCLPSVVCGHVRQVVI